MPRRVALSLCLLVVACKRGSAEEARPPEPVFETAAASADDGPLIISAWSGGVVKGVVSRAEGTLEPPVGSRLIVMLWGGRPAEGSKVLVQKDIEVAAASPWAFELALAQSEFDAESGYGVSAMLNGPTGDVLFSAIHPVAVFRDGVAQGLVELVLDPMDPRVSAAQ